MLVILIAYLLGSIPFGYLIVRAKEGSDIRQTGSGGTGATNVSRRAGKAAGIITLLLDALKGGAAVLFAMWALGVFSDGVHVAGSSTPGSSIQRWGGQGASALQADWGVAAAAIVVLIGHIFPIWLGFRGGKGVATGVGVFLVLAPTAVLIASIIFISIVLSTRYVSLGSIVAALVIPLLVWLQHVLIRPLPRAAPVISAALLGALLIVFAHRENIGRLAQGKERKFG